MCFRVGEMVGRSNCAYEGKGEPHGDSFGVILWKWAGLAQMASKESRRKRDKCVPDKKLCMHTDIPVYEVVKACCGLETAISLDSRVSV